MVKYTAQCRAQTHRHDIIFLGDSVLVEHECVPISKQRATRATWILRAVIMRQTDSEEF